MSMYVTRDLSDDIVGVLVILLSRDGIVLEVNLMNPICSLYMFLIFGRLFAIN